jgi:cytochrome c-type biogenesis protein CcmH
MRGRTAAPASLSRLAVALLLLWSAVAAAQDIMLDPQVFDIGRELRCPTCVAESVAESNAGIAREMRQIIQEQLDQGSSRAEILSFFQDRYGDWILLTPPRSGVLLIVWLLPIAAALAGVAALVLIVRRWRKAADETVAATPDDLARVRAALAGGGPTPATTADDDAGPAPAPRR